MHTKLDMNATYQNYTMHLIMYHIWNHRYQTCDQEYYTNTLQTKFHIIGISSWTNIITTLHINVTHQFYFTYGLHITVYIYQTITNCNIYSTLHCQVCITNQYVHQITHACHIGKLFDLHIWGYMCIKCASYEATAIKHVTSNAVHIQQWPEQQPQWQNLLIAYATFGLKGQITETSV